MSDLLQFKNRSDFRKWLEQNCISSPGVWLIFEKKSGPETLTAAEALEEALCFGWIDGQMKSIDENSYLKYFSIRRDGSNWSDKNKALTEILQKKGLMTEYGKIKIAEAKESGQWDKIKVSDDTDEQISLLTEILKEYELAYTHFMGMSPSVKKTYTWAYFDAKTEEGKIKRLAWMVDRLNKNLKPM